MDRSKEEIIMRWERRNVEIQSFVRSTYTIRDLLRDSWNYLDWMISIGIWKGSRTNYTTH